MFKVNSPSFSTHNFLRCKLPQFLRKQSAENNFEVALQQSNATLCSIRKTEQEKLSADLLDVELQGAKPGPPTFPLYGRNAGIFQSTRV